MKIYRGVILDIDGTLVDSNDAHALSWKDALQESGFHCSYEEIRRLIGKGSGELIHELTGLQEHSPQAQVIAERHLRVFRERFLTKITAFPKVRDLVERLKEDGLELTIANAATPTEDRLLNFTHFNELLKVAEIDDLVSANEPDTNQIPPDQWIMLADTPYDIEAARRFGVDTVALRSGGWSDVDLRNAVAIYNDPADLLANFDDSPFGLRGFGAGEEIETAA